jgi:hypothetical protein
LKEDLLTLRKSQQLLILLPMEAQPAKEAREAKMVPVELQVPADTWKVAQAAVQVELRAMVGTLKVGPVELRAQVVIWKMAEVPAVPVELKLMPVTVVLQETLVETWMPVTVAVQETLVETWMPVTVAVQEMLVMWMPETVVPVAL